MEVVSGPGGRRRWTREAKLRIIEETLRPGANVAEVARRYGLVPQQLYSWRSTARGRASLRPLARWRVMVLRRHR
jgi:transposase